MAPHVPKRRPVKELGPGGESRGEDRSRVHAPPECHPGGTLCAVFTPDLEPEKGRLSLVKPLAPSVRMPS